MINCCYTFPPLPYTSYTTLPAQVRLSDGDILISMAWVAWKTSDPMDGSVMTHSFSNVAFDILKGRIQSLMGLHLAFPELSSVLD